MSTQINKYVSTMYYERCFFKSQNECILVKTKNALQ